MDDNAVNDHLQQCEHSPIIVSIDVASTIVEDHQKKTRPRAGLLPVNRALSYVAFLCPLTWLWSYSTEANESAVGVLYVFRAICSQNTSKDRLRVVCCPATSLFQRVWRSVVPINTDLSADEVAVQQSVEAIHNVAASEWQILNKCQKSR